jgi:glycosyltransferase involved in cell wall biosynthesis
MIMKSEKILLPELSIIMPNYNNAPFLDDSLQSILKQTFNNFEIIVCDDCSTDNSIDILKRYAAKYPAIRHIVNEKNMGVAETRHNGILHAKGEFFTVLDSDDIFYDTRKLEKEMEIVKRYKQKHNKIVCAFSKIAILSKDLEYIHDQWPEDMIKEGYIFNEIITRTVMIPRDYIVATSAYFDVGKYDKYCTPYEDWDLKIRLAKKYEYHFTGIYGTGYRKHGIGLSNLTHVQNIQILKRVFKKNIILADLSSRKQLRYSFANFIQSIRLRRVNAIKATLASSDVSLFKKIFIRFLLRYNEYLYTIKK